ncbi:hypothetical protein GCM10027440_19460 [Nocardiopsis coralliicola]
MPRVGQPQPARVDLVAPDRRGRHRDTGFLSAFRHRSEPPHRPLRAFISQSASPKENAGPIPLILAFVPECSAISDGPVRILRFPRRVSAEQVSGPRPARRPLDARSPCSVRDPRRGSADAAVGIAWIVAFLRHPGTANPALQTVGLATYVPHSVCASGNPGWR